MITEVFGAENFLSQITIVKTSGATGEFIAGVTDHVIFFSKDKQKCKFRSLYKRKIVGEEGSSQYKMVIDDVKVLTRRIAEDELYRKVPRDGWEIFAPDNLTSQGMGREKGEGAASWFPVAVNGNIFRPSIKARWKTNEEGMARLQRAQRLHPIGNTLMYRRMLRDFTVFPINNVWNDVIMTGFSEEKLYVVQSSARIVERCILMASDPGDLVLDPTCGSRAIQFCRSGLGVSGCEGT